MEDTNQAAPASWLGFKLINQAAADEMGAAVLPSDKSLSGRVWLNLTDADGDPIYVAGIVVGVSFTAAAVRYSVAFPVAPQPRAGETLYAVVENVESGLVLGELPEEEAMFDAVLTEEAAALIPRARLEPSPVPVLDSVSLLDAGRLGGELTERVATLESALATDADPMYTLGVIREVVSLTAQVRSGERAPVAELDPTEWPGYAEVLRDEGKAIKWQDRLDSFFGERVVALRKALRSLGWDGEQWGALTKAGIIARFDFWQVGAGKNVVGMTINGIRDDLTKNVDELAAAIDATAALPEPVGPSAQFESYRAYIEKELAEGRAIAAGMLEQIRMDTRLNDGEADQLEALAVPAPTTAPVALPNVPSAELKAAVLSAVFGQSPKAVEPVSGWKYLTARMKGSGRGVYVVDGTFDRATFKVVITEAREAGLDPNKLSIYGRLGTYSSDSVTFTNLNDYPALQNAEPESDQQDKPSMETLIKIAADTLAQLRRIDVYRVLDAAGEQRAELATYIATNRADLVREVTDVMAEEWPDLGWTFAEPVQPSPVARIERPGDTQETGDGEGGATVINPQRAADMAFLNSVVSNSTDMWADDLADKIEALGPTYEGDAEVSALWGQAIQAYTDFMVAAMG